MTGFQVTVGANEAATQVACQVNQGTGIYTIFKDECALDRTSSPVREVTHYCVRRHCIPSMPERVCELHGEGTRGGGNSGRNSHPGIAGGCESGSRVPAIGGPIKACGSLRPFPPPPP